MLAFSGIGSEINNRRKMELVCIQDYEDKAGQLLAKRAFNYYKLGAGQMTTLQLNRDYYKRWAYLIGALRF